MKFETTAAFDTDFRKLKRAHAQTFRAVIRDFSAACDGFAEMPGYRWPASLRVAPMRGTAGLWEMTWSFSSPDGRATFEFVRRDGHLVCRWRRCSDHGVFVDP